MPDPIQFLSVRPGRGKVADDFRRPARFGKIKKELLKMAVKYWFIRKAFDGQQKQSATKIKNLLKRMRKNDL